MSTERRAGRRAHAGGGHTGIVAVLVQGNALAVGLRVDIDGIHVKGATEDEHLPARKGFHSKTGETVHACEHDGHMP